VQGKGSKEIYNEIILGILMIFLLQEKRVIQIPAMQPIK